MNTQQALAAAAKAAGKITTLTAWSDWTTPRTLERREEGAAGRQAKHRAIGRVKVSGEARYDERGRVSFLFTASGMLDRTQEATGIVLNKKGEPTLSLIIGAPTEYGYTTACPNAGKLGTACEKRKPFHAHRSVNLTRLVSWVIAGEEQVEV